MHTLQERRSGYPLTPAKAQIRRAGLSALALGLAVIAIDQLTKSLALEILDDGPKHLWPVTFRLVINTGAVFGIASGISPVLISIGVLVVAGLLWGTGMLRDRASAFAAGAIMGGALSNLIDRFFRNHEGVVDFIDIGWWPVFNFADIAIVVGAALVVLLSFRADKNESKEMRTS